MTDRPALENLDAVRARVRAALPPYDKPIYGDTSRGMQLGWDRARQAALSALEGEPAALGAPGEPDRDTAADALAAEYHRRYQRLEDLAKGPNAQVAIREHVRGELVGLRGALGLLLGGRVQDGTADLLGWAHYQEWRRRQETADERTAAEAYDRVLRTPPSAEACAALRERLESGQVARRKVRRREAGEAVCTVTVTVHAPTAENAASWAQTISDLVAAEYGQEMRLNIQIDRPRKACCGKDIGHHIFCPTRQTEEQP